jgi:hypothetical protein
MASASLRMPGALASVFDESSEAALTSLRGLVVAFALILTSELLPYEDHCASDYQVQPWEVRAGHVILPSLLKLQGRHISLTTIYMVVGIVWKIAI